MSLRPGFSLIEAVFALVLLGAIAVGALAATAAHGDAAVRAQRMLEASILADFEIARIASLSPAALSAAPHEVAEQAFDSPFERYRATTRITRMPDDVSVFDVAVAVFWDNGRFDLATRLYRPVAGTP